MSWLIILATAVVCGTVVAAAVLVGKDVRWLRRVVPAWMFHIGALLRGEDPPGDAPIPDDLVAPLKLPPGWTHTRLNYASLEGVATPPPPDYAAMTQDDVAREIIYAGVARGITPRGIQIALATAIVESNLTVYTNLRDPYSETICPKCPDSFDGSSTGVFQQQAFAEWGGTTNEGVEARMDPARAANQFYDHMLEPDNPPAWTLPISDLDYNDPAYTPGQVAQNVQRSAFPTRYDAVFGHAQAIYARLAPVTPPPSAAPAPTPAFHYENWAARCPNFESRQNTAIDLELLHTEEGNSPDAMALANFLISTAGTDNPRSYHRTIDNQVNVIDVVDMPNAAWAVGASNYRSINMCFAGSTVNWSRAEWLANMGAGIDVAAYLAVLDCRAWGMPLTVLDPPYAENPPGISDHRYCSVWLRDGNNHVDVDGSAGSAPPFNKFPWDYFKAAVYKYAGLPVPAPLPAPPRPGGRTYVVQSGDTLDGIAQQFGVDASQLAAVNHIENPNLIIIGQVLTIP